MSPSAGVPSPSAFRCCATLTAFIEGLNSPFGMALIGSDLYVATLIDRRGALLVVDDVGNAVWRVSPLER